eukprot:31471-Pelagococcus_subviridis.AAC.15
MILYNALCVQLYTYTTSVRVRIWDQGFQGRNQGRVVSKSRFRLKTSSARADRSSLRFQIVSYPWFTCRRRGRFCRGQPPRRRDDATTPFNEPSLQTRGANRKRVMNAIAKKNAASLPSRI